MGAVKTVTDDSFEASVVRSTKPVIVEYKAALLREVADFL